MADYYKPLALLCFVISILAWMPNLVFQVPSPLYLLTFVLGPVGAILAGFGRQYLLLALNVLMFFSFFILMAFGYWAASLFS